MRRIAGARFLIVILIVGHLFQFLNFSPHMIPQASLDFAYEATSSSAIVVSSGAITVNDLVEPEISFDPSNVTSESAIYIDIVDTNPPEAEYLFQTESDLTYETDLKQLASGYYFTLSIDNGELYGWGRNSSGQLGLGHSDPIYSPEKIALPKPALKISAGYKHAIALMSDGRVAVWGDNGYGQLGDNTTTDSNIPVILNLENIIDVSAGYYNSYAIDNLGNVYGWGRNDSGQLGTGDTSNKYIPTQMILPDRAVQIEAGYKHVLVRTAAGNVYATGDNGSGQLGLGDDTDRVLPEKIALNGDVKDIATDYKHSGGVLADGKIAVWGYNSSGQLGDGETSFKMTPVYHEFDAKSTQISIGRYHTLILLEDGTLVGAGDDGTNQLFNASGGASFTPIGLPQLVTQIDSGYKANIIAVSNGDVYAFGNNSSGELGNGSTTGSTNLERAGILNISDLGYLGLDGEVTNIESWQSYPNKMIDISAIKSNRNYLITPYVRAVEGDTPLIGTPINVFIISELSAPPTNIQVIDNAATTMTLSWNAIAFVDSYSIEVNGTDVYDTSDNTYQLTELQSNTEYDIRVRSNNAIGEGAWSSTYTFRTKAGIMDYQLPSQYQTNGINLEGGQLTLGETIKETNKSIIFYSTFENAGIYDFSDYEMVVVADTDVNFNKRIRDGGTKVFQYIAFGSRFENSDAFVDMIKSEIQNFKDLEIADGIFFDEVSVGYWGSGYRNDPEKIGEFRNRLKEITDYVSSLGMESIINGSTGFADLGEYYLWESFLGTFGEMHFVWSINSSGRTEDGAAGINYYKSINDWMIEGDLSITDTIAGNGPAALEILIDTSQYVDSVDNNAIHEWMDLKISGSNISSTNTSVSVWLGDSLPFNENDWYKLEESPIDSDNLFKIREYAKYIKLRISIDDSDYTIDNIDMWFDRNFEYYDVVSNYTPGEHEPYYYEYNLSKRDYLQNIMNEFGTRIFTHTFGEADDIEKMRFTRLASQIWGFYTNDFVESHRILTDTSGLGLNLGLFLNKIDENSGQFTGGTVSVNPETHTYNIVTSFSESAAFDEVEIDGDMIDWADIDTVYTPTQDAFHIYPQRYKVDSSSFEMGTAENLKEVVIDDVYGLELISDGDGSWVSPVIYAHDENVNRIGKLTRFYDQVLNDGGVTYDINIENTSGIWSGWQPLSYDAPIIGSDFKSIQYRINVSGYASNAALDINGTRVQEARIYWDQYLPEDIEVTKFSIQDDENNIYIKFDVTGEVGFTDIGKRDDYGYSIYLNTLGDKAYGYKGKYFTADVGSNYKIENGSIYIWDDNETDKTSDNGWIELGNRSPLVYFARSNDKSSVEISVSKDIVNLNQEKLYAYMRLQEKKNWTNNFVPYVTSGRSDDVRAIEYTTTKSVKNVKHGYYLSEAYQIKPSTDRIMIEWSDNEPLGTSVDVWLRESTLDSWAAWRKVQSGEVVEVDGGYLQYVVALSSEENRFTPEVTNIVVNEWRASNGIEFVKVEPVGDDNLISWNYSATSGGAIEIEVDGTPIVATGNEYVHENLGDNEFHSYRFRPFIEGSSFEWSDPLNTYTLLEKPLNYDVHKTLESITVDWESVSGATEYEVMINGKTSSTVLSTFTVNDILPGQWFNVHFRAKNNNTFSEWTSILNISTMPSQITDLNGTAQSNRVDLSWSEISNTDYYELEINGNVFEVSPGQTSFVHRTNKIIDVDGNRDDWYDILNTAKYNDLSYLKTLRSGDDLYILLVEDGLGSNGKYRVLLNTDDDRSTGFIYRRWETSGFDILIENGRLYRHSGASDKYDWTFLGLIDEVRADDAVEVKVDLTNISAVSNFIEIATWTDGMTLPFEGTLPARIVDASLESNSVQTYKIRGHNSTGYGLWSEAISIRTVLAPVEDLVMSYENRNLVINWAPDSDAISYDIEIDGTVYNSTTSSYTYVNVQNNQTYSVRVRANSIVDAGEWTQIQEIRTPLAQITDLHNTSLESRSFVVSWTEDPSATSYEVDVNGEKYNTISAVFEYTSDKAFVLDGSEDDWGDVESVFEAAGGKKLSAYMGQEHLYIYLKNIGSSDSPRIILDSDGNTSTGYKTSYWADSGAEYLIENDRLYSYSGSGTDYTWTFIGTVVTFESTNGVEIRVPYSIIGYTDVHDMKIAYWDSGTHIPTKYTSMLALPRKTLVPNEYYNVKVRPVNGGLESEWSDSLSVLTSIETPEFKTFDVENGNVLLLWDTRGNGSNTDYQVTLIDTSSNTIKLTSDWLKSDQFVTSGLNLGEEYHVYLAVRNQDGIITSGIDFGVHTVRKYDAISINVHEDQKKTVTVSASNIRTFSNKSFKVLYDTSKLGLLDLSTYTLEHESDIGRIVGTFIIVTNVQPGEITFEIDRPLVDSDVWTGILNVIEFIGLSDGNSEIQFIVE